MDRNGTLVSPGQGEAVMALGTLVVIKVPAALTGNRYAVIEHTVPPQAGPPPHTHPEAEILYILEGEFDCLLGTEVTRLTAGGVVNVAPGVLHRTVNVGRRAGKLLSVYVPGEAEGFFREAGTPISQLEQLPDLDQPADLGKIDFAAVFATAAKYGMKVTPPVR